MKKVLCLLAGIMVMASAGYAATSAAPVFNTPVKVAEGKVRGPASKVAVDGTTIYAAFEEVGTQEGRISKSTNGVTWGLSISPEAGPAYASRPIRVAVSDDPVYTGLKIVHAVWGTYGDPAGDVVKYSYFTTRPNETGWSTPINVNSPGAAADDINLAVAKTTGAVHLLLGSAYTKASAPGAAFDYPVSLATPGSRGSLVIDAQNNLYAAFSDGTFTRKPSGGNWTAPVTFTASGAAITDYVDLAVANSSNYYIAYANATTSKIVLSTSTNSGTNWTPRDVTAYSPLIGPSPAIAVTATKVLTLVAPVELSASNVKVVKAFRTNDNGVSWSSPVTVQTDDDQPTIALDASNKVMIYGRDGQDGKDWSYLRNNGNTNLLFIKEK